MGGTPVKKKLFILFLVTIMTLSLIPGLALAAPLVMLDGAALQFDVPPVIENGRTLVPLRAIFEALGAEISWNGATQTVLATKAGTQVVLTIGNPQAYRNNAPVLLDVPPKIIEGRTMVPLRFVSEAMGADVKWDGVTGTILITSLADVVYEIHNTAGDLVGWYTGGMVNGYPNGQGTFTGVDGRRFSALFQNGQASGEVTCKWLSGEIYKGPVRNFLPDGNGMLKLADGRIFNGDFLQGVMNTEGVTLKWPSGALYKGQVVNFLPEGKGILKLTDGRVYEGDFVSGKMEGQGILALPDGSTYTGSFRNNLANGQGTLQYSTGKVYTGQFVDGMQDGQGTLTLPDGTKQTGTWVKNAFQS